MSINFSGQKWRLIDSGITDPAYTMAVDEALLLSRISNGARPNSDSEATLHLYSRNPPAVSLGYFQKVDDEVRTDLCRDFGVQILRRGSGGGAIYTDSEQLIYSLVIDGDSLGTIPDSFSTISHGVLECLKLFGLSPEFEGLNDVVISGKKISGCAQTRKKNVILQHGTILLDLDIDKMARLLTPSKMKFSDKNVVNLKNRLTCLSELLDYVPTHTEVKRNLIAGFENAFDVTIEPGKLSREECSLVEDLLERKYTNHDWNFRR